MQQTKQYGLKILCWGLFFLCFGCKPTKDSPQQSKEEMAAKEIYADSLLDTSSEPCVRFGKVHNKVSEKDLINLYGKANVNTYRDTIAGKPYATTMLFEGQKNELQIVWHNEELLQYPNVCLFTKEKTKWNVSENISIGTTLDQLNTLNGKPFEFTAFGSPNAGLITDFKGGKLQALSQCYGLVLDYDRKIAPILEGNLSGTANISSHTAGLQTLKIKIKAIRVFLNKKPQ
jgi:hypothetical protein